jgi:septal ring factor EnvC (AmiA/AmiB activator)
MALPPHAGVKSKLNEEMVMSEDLTKRLPDQPNNYAELLRLIQSIRAELADLKQTVDARLHDTRPIWEKVQADIAQLPEGQESLRKDVRDVRTELRDMNRKFSISNDNLVQIQADYRDTYDRVRDLERQRP